MNGYTKLFGSIIHSTIWQESHTVRVLWVTMLAMADQDGMVAATIPGLAHAAHITIGECEVALHKFQQPDKYSKSPVEDGRRIRPVDGGWQLINYLFYRDLMSPEDQKEKNRLRQQAFRDRRNAKRNAVTLRVTPNNRSNDIAEAEAEAEAYTKAKEEEKAPEGQPAINLAKGTADKLNLVATQSLLLDIEAAIKCAAKRRRVTLANACDYLIQLAIKARERGTKVNQFWFRDADGWEPNDNYKTTAQLRNERSASAIERAFAEDVGPEDLPRNIR